MIVFRAGLAFRISASDARSPSARAQFAGHWSLDREKSGSGQGSAPSPSELDFRRWWAEDQPEARWAKQNARGIFLVDVSHLYWRESTFLLEFDDVADAKAFALIFLGREQDECEAAMPRAVASATSGGNDMTALNLVERA